MMHHAAFLGSTKMAVRPRLFSWTLLAPTYSGNRRLRRNISGQMRLVKLQRPANSAVKIQRCTSKLKMDMQIITILREHRNPLNWPTSTWIWVWTPQWISTLMVHKAQDSRIIVIISRVRRTRRITSDKDRAKRLKAFKINRDSNSSTRLHHQRNLVTQANAPFTRSAKRA